MAQETLKTDTLIFSITDNPHIGLTNNSKVKKRSDTYRWDIDVRKASVIIEIQQPSRALIYFAIFLGSLQIFDGMLTSIGMARFGTKGEGNPFLRSIMEETTPDKALVIAKVGAILLVVALTVLAKRLPWIRDVIGVLSCIYLFAAIIPWVYIITYYF